LVYHLHYIHNYVSECLDFISTQMKTRYSQLANCTGYQKSVALYSNAHKGEVTQAPVLLGEPMQGNHPN
jgi:hypothetical protein